MAVCELNDTQPASNRQASPICEGDPITRFLAAFRAHNEDPSLEPEYLAALSAMDEYQPRTSRDALRKFVAMYDRDGHPTEDREKALIAQAKHVLRNEANASAKHQAVRRMALVAQEISIKAGQIVEIIETCDEAARNLYAGYERSEEEQSAALRRIDLFHDLARSVAAQIEKAGEQIERMESDLGHPNANLAGVH